MQETEALPGHGKHGAAGMSPGHRQREQLRGRKGLAAPGRGRGDRAEEEGCSRPEDTHPCAERRRRHTPGGTQPRARMLAAPGAAGEAAAGAPLEPPEGTGPTHTWISGFRAPELRENEFLLIEATKFVAVCYGSPRKRIH